MHLLFTRNSISRGLASISCFSYKLAITLGLIWMSINTLNSQVTIFSENFDSYANGTTTGPGWDGSVFNFCDGNPGTWGVQGGAFVASDAEGFNCCNCTGSGGPGNCGDNLNVLEIGPIDISAYCNVSITFTFAAAGPMECGSGAGGPCPASSPDVCLGGHDQAVFDYSVDGGAPTNFGFYCGNMLCSGGPFVAGINGNTLSFSIVMGTQSGNESYTVDNIVIEGFEGPMVDVSSNAPVCEGGVLILSETGGQATSWNWTGPNSYSSTSSSPTITNVTSAASGTYFLTVSDPFGCTRDTFIDVSIEIAPDITGPTVINGCGSILLPPITGTNLTGGEAYYTGPNGTGTQFFPGDPIFSSITLFIFDDNNGCTDEESVTITITSGPDITGPFLVEGCDEVFLPAIQGTNLTGGEAYYTGPGGTGTQYFPGERLTATTLLYIYDDAGGGCSDEELFNVTIFDSPEITGPLTLDGCGFIELPTIQGINLPGGEAYYSMSGGMGIPYLPGDTIFTSQTLYIFVIDGNNCEAEEFLSILIAPSPQITGPTNIDSCGQVTLPGITGSNLSGNEAYFTGPGGTGTQYNPGDVITTSQTLYIFDDDGAGCTVEESINIQITDDPEITGPTTLDGCDFVILPPITGNNLTGNEGYFDMSNGSGINYSPGDTIFNSIQLFIYDSNGSTCSDEDTISVNVATGPELTGPSTLSACDSIILPAITGNNLSGNQAYFTASNGGGTQYNPGEVIRSSVTLFIYDQDNNNCADEISVGVTINSTPTFSLPDTLNSCDSINLPAISGANLSGNEAYFTARSGGGTQYVAGDTLLSSRVLYIFDQNSNCVNEDSVVIIINSTPNLQNPVDQSACGFFELPNIAGSNLTGNQAYFTTSRGKGTRYLAGDTLFSTTTLYLFDSLDICADEDTFIITIDLPLVAGDDNNASVCQGSTIDLSSLLVNADAGGSFSDDDATGALAGSIFNTNGIAIGAYRFTYSQAANGVCPADQSVITINVVSAVSAGNDNQGDLCQTNSIDLTTLLLSADAGGNFTDDDGTGALSGNIFNSSGIPAGTYRFTYTVGDGVICPQDQATITVNVVLVPDPFPGPRIDACEFFILPPIIGSNLSGNEGYYTAAQGGGTPLNVGDTVFTSDIIFLFDDNGVCSGEDNWEITINDTPNAGDNNSTSVCQGSTVDLTTLLQNANNGGTFSDDDATGGLTGSNFNSTGIGNGSYRFTYSVSPIGNCPGDQAVITVNVVNTVSAGNNNQTDICQGNTIDLTTLLLSADSGGTFSDDDGTGALSGSSFNSTGITVGTYNFTYTVGDGIVCPQDQSTISINVVNTPEPIADQNLDACDFFVLPTIAGNNLSGNEAYFTATQGGGTQLNVGDTIFSTTTIFLFDDNGICTGEDDWLITINNSPNAGNDNNASVCQGSMIDLSTLLQNADGGGVFSDDDGTGALFGSNFNTTGIVNGTYQFTYSLAANGTCPADQSVITINVVNAVTAGNDNQGTVCQGISIDLTTLLQSADGGGTFLDDDGTGALVGSNFNSLGIPPGTYRFTYSIGDGVICPQDQAIITVNVIGVPAPMAGSAIEACDFFVLPSIAGDNLTGNEAYYTITQGAGTQFNSGDTIFNSISLFLFDDNGTCSGEDTWSITISDRLEAGDDNNTSICEGSTIDLVSLLQNADSGGTFSDDDGTGALSGSTFNSTGILPGSYNFSYTVGDGLVCPQDQSTITVNVIAIPEPIADQAIDACDFFVLPAISGNNLSGNEAYYTATQGGGNQLNAGDTIFSSTILFLFDDNGNCTGEDSWTININTPLEAGDNNSSSVCQGSSIDLSTLLLNADIGGVFSDDDATGALSGNIFNSTGIANGTYQFTYEVPGVGVCPSDQAIININVVNAVSAGNDNQADFCQGSIIDLTTLLQSADLGGTFSDDDGTGALSANNFNTTGVNPGTYQFTYTVGDGVVCPQDQSRITITVVPVPDPFPGAPIDACDFFILPTIIGDDLSGNERYYTATQAGGNPLDPGDTIFSTTILFLFDDNGTCSGEDTWSINISEAPEAGDDNSVAVCQGSTIDLNTLLRNADNGGTFSDDDGTGALSGSNFNTTGVGTGTYRFTYNLAANGLCPADQATITIDVVNSVSAGNDVQEVVCASETIDLTLFLDGADVGGTFTENTSSGALSGSNFNTNGLFGTFSFTYTIGDGIVCPEDRSILTIDVIPTPEPIAGPAVDDCNFFVLPPISGNDLTGSVSYYSASLGGGTVFGIGDTIFDSQTIYLFEDNGVCSGQDTLEIVIRTTPIFNQFNIVCDDATNTYTVQFTIEEGEPSSYRVNGQLIGSNIFISQPIPSGAPYNFTITDDFGCGNTIVSGTHNCACAVDAGTFNINPLRVCEDAIATAFHNGDEQLRTNDLLVFVLHDGDANNLGTILATSSSPDFGFASNLQYGTTYYITAIAGQDDGSGMINLSDPCLSISEGTPVQFDQQVVAGITGDNAICPGETSSLTLGLNINGTIDLVYTDGISIDTLFGVTDGFSWDVQPTNNTTYTIVEILNSNSVCSPQIPSNTVQINVADLGITIQIESDFNGFGVSCNTANDGILAAIASGGQSPYTFTWNNGESTQRIEGLAANDYTLIVTDANGCSQLSSSSLIAPPSPDVSSTLIDPTCFGSSDGLILLDSINSPASLSFSTDGQNFQIIQDYPVIINNLPGGTQRIFIQENGSCISELNFVLNEPTIRIVELGQDAELNFGEELIIDPFLNFTPDSLIWGGDLFPGCLGCTELTLKPSASGLVNILAIDSLGCTAEDVLRVIVRKDLEVFIPNVFSPNADGNNDFFTVFANESQVEVIEQLTIFSRWGEQVFNQNNFPPNQLTAGWDGRFKGESMNPGVFLYVAKVRFFDGSVRQFQGDVTLVK